MHKNEKYAKKTFARKQCKFCSKNIIISCKPSLGSSLIVEFKYFRSVSQYKANSDYYRGKTKSIYEREPMFDEFVR